MSILITAQGLLYESFIPSGLSFISTGSLKGIYTSFLSGFVGGVLALDGAVCELLVLLIFWIAPETVLSLTLRGLSFIDSLVTAGRGMNIHRVKIGASWQNTIYKL